MDSFTAGFLLNTAQSCFDTALKLSKELEGLGPDAETAAKVKAMIGKRCKVDVGYEGVVTGLNEAKGGFYGGERYPVLVHIEKCNDGNPHTFEYGLDQIELIEE